MFLTVRLSKIRSLFTVHSAMVYVIQVCRQPSSRSICSCSKAVYKPVWHIPLLSVQWINSWFWTDELSETCRFSWQNKFVKLVHLVGFITKKFVTMQHGHVNVKKKIMHVLRFSANCHFETPRCSMHIQCTAQYYSEGQSELIGLFISKCYWWSYSLIYSVFVFEFWVYLWLKTYFRVQNFPQTYTFNMIMNYNVHNTGDIVDIICVWGGHKIEYFIIK